MSIQIEPRVLKGFRDSLPADEIVRREVISSLERLLQSYGFLPIDTPVLEYADVLLGKGGGETDKQVFRFEDHGKRDVAMRYDLTVPFARFMAAHGRDLPIPFKRYHIGKVWRGENTQRGRYREFMQCDFDIVGLDGDSADFEILLLISDCMKRLEVSNFTVRFSHRGIFNRFLAQLGLTDSTSDVLRIVDKLAKIGESQVLSLLGEIAKEREARQILDFIRTEHSFEETLAKMEESAGGPAEDSERLKDLNRYLAESEIADSYVLDPSITRGLDYYTGFVVETFLKGAEHFGSICSGGRYNDLASLYTKQELPGVGASIGIDRLLASLVESGNSPAPSRIPEVIVLCLDEDFFPHYHKIATDLRNRGISCEVYHQKRKLAQQFQYAERKGAAVAVICGEDERKSGTVNVKNLRTRDSVDGVDLAEVAKVCERLLAEESGGNRD